MWARISVNSSNIEENRAQIIYPLRVHFCTFLRPPRSYISELATAVFTQVLFVLSNHSRGPYMFGKCVSPQKSLRSKFVEMMLRKLQLWSLWRVAERNLSQSAYSDSCQPPWWWIIDHLCQSAMSPHSATKPIGGIWRDQKRKRTRKMSNHMMTKHLLEGTLPTSKTGPRVCRAIKLTHAVGQNSSTLQRKSFWDVPGGSSCSWCLHYTLWNCWSKPLPDSGASAQPRNQIKNQREKFL